MGQADQLVELANPRSGSGSKASFSRASSLWHLLAALNNLVQPTRSYSATSVSDQSGTNLTARTMALTWRYGSNGEIA